MAKTPLIALRCPPALRRELDLVKARKNKNSFHGDHTLSSIILDCVREVLDKPKRAKRSALKKKAGKTKGVIHGSQEVYVGPIGGEVPHG